MRRRSILEYLQLAITGFTTIGVFPFVIYRYLQGDIATALVDLMICLSMLVMFIRIYFYRKNDHFTTALPLVALLGVCGVLYLKGAQVIYWVFPAVVGLYYLLPIKKAFIFSVVFYFFSFLLIYQQLPLEQLISVYLTLAITCVFSYVFSRNMLYQHQQLKENSQLIDIRNKTLELIIGDDTLNEILTRIVHNVEQEFPDMLCSILLLDEKSEHLLVAAAPSLPDFYNEAVHGIKIGLGVGACGTSTFLGRRVIVDNIATHPYFQPYQELMKKTCLLASWSEPIKDSQQNVIGSFAIYHRKPCLPTDRDIKLIEQFSSLASISIERERANALIWQQANFDNLTGLPNRRMMTEHLRQSIKNAQRSESKIAVAFLDIDHFKDINDKLGHGKGDLLLVKVAKRIKQNVREQDMVARLGGDEFVVIINELNDINHLQGIANKLTSALAQPYQLENEIVHSSASIGFTVYPDDSMNVEALLKNADQAMYDAKNAGRNGYHFFTESMRLMADARLTMINDLRKAIVNDEFYVVYQPIVCLASNSIFKAEALVRWLHPVKGLINPVEFIEIAEETGLIIDISNIVFKKVVSQVMLWRETIAENFQISINTSPIQYKKNDGNILDWLAHIKSYHIPKDAIALEITENMLMTSQKGIADTLNTVREANIDLSIDDFGTGYSSFSYIRQYKSDYLKIDRSFVEKMSQDNNDAALCQAIIKMANILNIQIIAEGVETQEQRNLLAKFGCNYAQGYYFSKPVVSEEFERLISEKYKKE